MRDLYVVMPSISTRQTSRERTLLNLQRAGLHTSERVAGFELFEHAPGERTGILNTATALKHGAAIECKWVLFLEDDIDVIANFFDAVGLWLDRHGWDDRRVFSFSVPHAAVLSVDGPVFNYPRKYFCCTQAFAIRPDDAASLSRWLFAHPSVTGPDGNVSTGAYDLAMREWARTVWPSLNYFSGAVPNFVEHVGEDSVLSPGQPLIRMPGWPGREWSYK